MKYIENVNELIREIKELLPSASYPVTLAIDGRCASGKTTVGEKLKEYFACNLFHMDDYFLLPEQRTVQRLTTPGGNFDIERFTKEIICGINSGKDFCFSAFDCKTMSLKEKTHVTANKLNIIEGSYSCHPKLSPNYSLTVFMTVDKEEQKKRILQRNPNNAEMFFTKWIPLEEKYFSHFNIDEKCDLILRT